MWNKRAGKQIYFRISEPQTTEPPDRLILGPQQLPSRKPECASSKQAQAWTPLGQGPGLGAQRNAGLMCSCGRPMCLLYTPGPTGPSPPAHDCPTAPAKDPPPLFSAHRIISGHPWGHSEHLDIVLPKDEGGLGAAKPTASFPGTN